MSQNLQQTVFPVINLICLEEDFMKTFKFCIFLSLSFLFSTHSSAYAQSAPELVLQAKIFEPGYSSVQKIFSPDGKRFAQIKSLDRHITIFDSANASVINTFKLASSNLQPVAVFSRDGRKLAVNDFFNGASLYDAETGERLRSFQLRGVFEANNVTGLAFTPDDRYLITGGWNIRVWEVATGRIQKQLDGHQGAIYSIALSPDGKTLASAGEDKTVRFWSLTEGKELKQIAVAAPVKQIAFSKNGQTLNGFNDSRDFFSWNAATGKQTGKFTITAYPLYFSTDGESFSTVDENGKRGVFAAATGKIIALTAASESVFVEKLETNSISGVSFVPNQGGLLVFGGKSAIRFPFKNAQSVQVKVFDDASSYIEDLAYSPNGAFVLTKEGGFSIKLRDGATGKILKKFPGDYKNPSESLFKGEVKLLAVNDAGEVFADSAKETIQKNFGVAQNIERLVSFSADGKTLLALSKNKAIVLDAPSGKEKFSISFSIYNRAALSPDGKLLAANGAGVSSEDRTTIWDVETGARVRDLMQARMSGADSGEANSALAFSPDGKILACANTEGFIEFWDAASGERIGQLAGQRGQIDKLQFDAEGKILASIADDEIALWNVAERRKIADIYTVGESDWAVVAPDARFEATATARKLLHWVQDGKTLPVETFSAKFETTELLGKLMAETNSSSITRFKNDAPLAPVVNLQATVNNRAIGEYAEIKVQITARGGGFGELQLRHNGKIVAADSAATFKAESNDGAAKTYHLPLAPGTNAFSAVVFTAGGIAGEETATTIIEAENFISAAKREIVLPLGQTGKIFALTTSGDGKTLASLSAEDRTIKLWDATTGRELRTFTADKGFFASFAFSPDGKTLATGNAYQDSQSQTRVELTVWDVKSGLAIKSFDDWGEDSHPGIADIAFSRDGKFLASVVGRAEANYDNIGKYGKRLVVRDLETGKQWRIFSAEKNFRAPVFSADGKSLIVADDKVIKFIDLATGKTAKKLEGHTDSILAVALSPDGQFVATASKDDTARLWSAEQIGAAKFTFAANAKDVKDIAFSPDGKTVLTAGEDGAIRFWNAPDGALNGTVTPPEKSIYAVAFALGGQFFASAHDDGVIKLWNAESTKERRTLSRQTEPVKRLFFDPADGQLIGSTVGGSQRWQIERMRLSSYGTLAQNLAGFLSSFGDNGYSLTPNFSVIAYLNPQEKTISVRRLDAKQAVDAPDLPGEYVWLARLAAQIQDPKLEIKLKNLPVGKAENSSISHLAISDDGKTVIAAGEAGIKVWNAADGGGKAFQSGSFSVSSLSLNANGTQAAIGNNFGAVGIWNIAANKYRTLREANLDYYFQPVTKLIFSPDGKLLAGVMSDASLIVWDVGNGAEKLTLPGHKGGTNALVFHPSAQILISGGADGQTKIWDLKTGKETASLIAVGSRDYVAVTPDGFYTASKNAAQAISIRAGGEIAPFEQFDLKYNRPDIVIERVGLAEPETVRIYRQAVEKRLKRLGYSIDQAAQTVSTIAPDLSFVTEPPAQTKERMLSLKVKADGKESNLKTLEISVNGVPAGDNAFDGKTKAAEKEIKIELQRGANKIKIVAASERGAHSQPLEFETRLETDFARPNLYVLVVGVSEYADPRRKLNYAAKDANDVAKFFESKQPRFGKVEVHRLLNQDATKEKIIGEREFLMRAGVEDEVVIFLAGHGLLDRDLNYYFGTHAVDFQNPTEKGLRYEDLESLLDKLQARKKLLLMDTCHAGEVDKENVRLAAPLPPAAEDSALAEDKKSVVKRGVEVNDLSGQSNLGLRNSFELLSELFTDLRGSSGAQVIAAASGVEVAYERGTLKNGVFTFALLEALNSESADLNADGKLQVFELRDYVNRRVTKLTDGVQTPVMRAENIEFDFGVF